jgi:pimeloyl-ACP methyl ester carboxylesterase
VWHFVESGSGRPIVLLHGIGMSHVVWTPVTPLLARTRRVIAFDIAGFGRTPPLPDGITPTVAHLVDALEGSLRELGVELPVDIAGNSLGGVMALEAGRRGLARTVVAISPPGLWVRVPRHVPYVFRFLRMLVTRLPRLARFVVSRPALRELALAIPISTGTRRMPLQDALQVIADLAAASAFETTYVNTISPFVARAIKGPVTVAFGRKDWIVTPAARRRAAVPWHTRWTERRRWGHVPMWTDPSGVAALILKGTECAR